MYLTTVFVPSVDLYSAVFAWTLPAVFLVSPLIGWSLEKTGSSLIYPMATMVMI